MASGAVFFPLIIILSRPFMNNGDGATPGFIKLSSGLHSITSNLNTKLYKRSSGRGCSCYPPSSSPFHDTCTRHINRNLRIISTYEGAYLLFFATCLVICMLCTFSLSPFRYHPGLPICWSDSPSYPWRPRNRTRRHPTKFLTSDRDDISQLEF